VAAVVHRPRIFARPPGARKAMSSDLARVQIAFQPPASLAAA